MSSEPGVEIRHAGVFDGVADLDADSVDAVVFSPPYWGLRDYQIDDQLGVERDAQTYVDRLAELGEQLQRVLREHGSVWINLRDTYNGNSIIRPHSSDSHPRPGDDEYADQLAENRDESGVLRRSSAQFDLPRRARLQIPERVAIAWQERGWILRDEIIWAKPSATPEGRVTSRLRQSHEKIYRFVLSEHNRFQRDAIDYDTNVWTIPTADSDHPAPFPAEIPRRAIQLTTNPGDTVLDPFVGGGTTAETAFGLGRDCIGIELNPEFVQLARQRLQAVQTDLSVFGGESA